MSVVVVGGGVAGLAAASRLAEAGRSPTLFEARRRLGGRASSFTEPATGHRLDNGQHLLMGCNSSVRAFLDRIGSADAVAWQPRLDLPLASKSHGDLRLRFPRLPGALAALTGLLTMTGLSWADRMGAARAVNELLRGGAKLADLTVAELLDGLGCSEAARDHIVEPLTLAALNDAPRTASAAALAAVVREAFGGGAEAAGLGLPRKDLESLFALPARRYIEDRGGRVETARPVEAVAAGGRGVEGVVLAGGEAVWADAVVAAVPPWVLKGLLSDEMALEGLEALPVSSIVSATFWFDGEVMDEPLVGLVGTRAQWAFNRSRLLGLAGPGQVVAVTVSAADELLKLPKEAIVEILLEDLRSLKPQAASARLERAVVVKERRATVPIRPGESPGRPGARSAAPALYFAGGWTATGLPDTLESAVRSGEAAAEALLADLRGGPVLSRPSAG